MSLCTSALFMESFSLFILFTIKGQKSRQLLELIDFHCITINMFFLI